MPDNNERSPYPASVVRLIEQFSTLPGIGKRSAERLAYHVLSSPRQKAMDLATAIRDVKKNIRACSRCFNVADGELCAVCENPKRDHGLICVVELPRDIMALEKSSDFRGVYHVLQGHLSPADGMGPEQIRVNELIKRITEGEVREILLAMNPNTEGDSTAHFLASELEDYDVRVTRLARGLASGTDLESTAPSSLKFAIDGRQDFS